MIICENQTFPTQNSFYDGHPLDGETMFVYPTNIEGETKVNGICCSFSADSDRGYCQSYNTGSSSDGDQWDQFSTADVDDDVFTEREVVLAYDGSEVTSYSYGSCEMAELKREKIDQECPVSFTTEEYKQGYRDNFKDEMEEFTDISISEDFAFPLDNKDNSVGTGDDDINCSDSFLKWLDSEHVFSSSPTSSEDYYTNDSFENDNEDSSRNQLFYRESSLSSDDCYSSKATKNRPSLPPIQTMIPPWSRMIYSFDPDRSLNTTSSLFDSHIEGWNDLHSDNVNVGISEKLGDYGNVSSKSYHSNENDQLPSYAGISEIIIPDSDGNTMDDLPRRRETTSVKSMERGQVVIDQKCLLECRWEGCWSVFSGQAALVHHIEKSHVEQRRSDEFACLWQHCPRRVRPFNARYKLLIHMRVHSGEKPNKCPFSGCMKAFSRLENLKIHQRSHTGERPYSCQFPSCHKAFSNSSDRAKHQRTHYDTKPYACQAAGCRKRYTDPSSLRKHIKNHTGTTMYKNKKLMASEPVVYISSLEPHERRRLNSYVSDYGSDNQEEEYISNPNESMEETSDIELSEVHQEYGHFGLTKKIPKEITSCMADLGEMPKDLDLDIDDQLIEELDPYNIIPFADDILDLLCK